MLPEALKVTTVARFQKIHKVMPYMKEPAQDHALERFFSSGSPNLTTVARFHTSGNRRACLGMQEPGSGMLPGTLKMRTVARFQKIHKVMLGMKSPGFAQRPRPTPRPLNLNENPLRRSFREKCRHSGILVPWARESVVNYVVHYRRRRESVVE